mmetsp:Transcript_4389/g.8367  ORF Transcript_4389/g.8367 Transcript_4389/m.8367 type:complete len:471 (-) Transcript_4389:48-1460(-)
MSSFCSRLGRLSTCTRRLGGGTTRLLLSSCRQQAPILATTARRCFASLDTNDQEENIASILDLPEHFLRAHDSANFDPQTFQRTDVQYDSHTGKPLLRASNTNWAGHHTKIVQCQETSSGFWVKWSDRKESFYSQEWVEHQCKLWKGTTDTDRILWTGLDEAKVRKSADLSLEFGALLTKEGTSHALKALYQYGILLVTGTPIQDHGAGIAAMGAALGGGAIKNQLSLYKTYKDGRKDLVLPHGTDGPLRTLYGTVWATSSASQVEGSSRADSAYGSDGLPLHTDMTYHRDPPGLQIFTMAKPASQGGESVFGDGFAAAERLRDQHPGPFETLSSVARRYQSRDMDTGWYLEATGPVIQTDDANRVVAIRHNDLDRLPDIPPPDSTDEHMFYEKLAKAHHAWDRILAQDDTRLVMSLEAGETMVVANQRCFHGRFGFTMHPEESPRSVMGCYVSQDELNSRWRMEGYLVP